MWIETEEIVPDITDEPEGVFRTSTDDAHALGYLEEALQRDIRQVEKANAHMMTSIVYIAVRAFACRTRIPGFILDWHISQIALGALCASRTADRKPRQHIQCVRSKVSAPRTPNASTQKAKPYNM